MVMIIVIVHNYVNTAQYEVAYWKGCDHWDEGMGGASICDLFRFNLAAWKLIRTC